MSRLPAALVAVALCGLLLGCHGSRDRAETLAGDGLTLARGGKLDEAIDVFRRALQLDGSNAKARYNLGLALLARSRPAEAAAEFEAFVAARPGDALGHLQAARAYRAAGQPARALATLQASVAAGLQEPAALALPDFDSLRDDLQFVQLELVVAQRAGVAPPSATDFSGRGTVEYGGTPLRPAPLPGTNINRALDCGGGAERRPGDAGACEPDTSP